jgi:hypothetical protein
VTVQWSVTASGRAAVASLAIAVRADLDVPAKVAATVLTPGGAVVSAHPWAAATVQWSVMAYVTPSGRAAGASVADLDVPAKVAATVLTPGGAVATAYMSSSGRAAVVASAFTSEFAWLTDGRSPGLRTVRTFLSVPGGRVRLKKRAEVATQTASRVISFYFFLLLHNVWYIYI